ncbi:hypothetical protein DXG03_007124 [Asterophora parasitica]|uniref:NUDE domain-containing protein n=1 Tax=Asterophora parasitica TaxID=117018 RepID=A0A9P7KG03_9AGAR|nr:hypothetical protein DXG03_007124 [Asterophora parasitica]
MPTDALHRDRHMFDDNDLKTPLILYQVADMLAETRAELDDFHHASKELEAELENELQRTEKAQQDLKVKVIRAESERDEWKSKFMSLQTNHNTTTASLQRELDKIRQDYQQVKIQLRDLEMGNDDLERNERAVSSSLADMESKYSRALEEKILLEHELLEKASLEEESQRLRDELRDANVEISILKDQVAIHSSASSITEIFPPQPPPTDFRHSSAPSDDDLLNTPPPPDLQLDDLSKSSSESLPLGGLNAQTTPKAGTTQHGGQSVLLDRPGFNPPGKATPPAKATPPNARMMRSTTLPSLYASTPRTPTMRAPMKSTNASTSTASTASATSKSKGVQMVSEMRARVRNLEQKIHTRVPRLRMGSITGRSTNSNALALLSNATSSSSSSSSKTSTAKTSWESLAQRRSGDSRRSNDSGSDKNRKESPGDSSGWVLIMEDSPPPTKDKERRRVSSPSGGAASTSFRPAIPTSLKSPTFGSNTLNASTMNPSSGIRRPQSRLSAGSLSTTTTSSIPTPTSRPATPTFLPVPSGSLYASTAGMTGLKRSTGPGGPNPYSQSKRSSLGSTTTPNLTAESRRERPTPLPRPMSGTPSSGTRYNAPGKALPQLPSLHANITLRAGSKAPPSVNGMSVLAQSRIGRPGSSGGLSGRRSTDGTSSTLLGLKPDSRTRSGSTSTPPTR